MTITNAVPAPDVLIDGCPVPFELYRAARVAAIKSHKTQFIGVRFAPHSMRPVKFLVGWEREELHDMGGMHMILWITPKAEEA